MSKDSEGRVSHDQNFKNLIIDYPRQAIELFASEVALLLDDTVKITPIRQELLKDRLGDRFFELDVPLQLEWQNGERKNVVFIFEEQTNPRQFSIKKLAVYCLQVAELTKNDCVIPVVIFLKNHRQSQQLQLGDDFYTCMNFNYIQVTLPKLNAMDFLNSNNIVARFNLPLMRHDLKERLTIYHQSNKAVFELEPDIDKQRKYLDYIDFYAKLNDQEREQYEQQLKYEDKHMQTAYKTIYQRKFEEGIEHGVEQGIEEGLQQGWLSAERKTLQRQLTKRFGEITAYFQKRIDTADPSQLEQWLDNFVDAETIEQVFQ